MAPARISGKLNHPVHNVPVSSARLERRLGPFDATMIVMGGIVGSGIFMNPYVVAREVHSSALILGVWIAGGLIALLGAFVYAELAAIHPQVGGQYAYLRDGIHPAVAFLYGWALLLVVQSGGMAAVAITFARYLIELTGIAAGDWIIATLTLAVLTLVNCLGVRSGSNTQSLLMLLKIAAILGLIVAGAFFVGGARVDLEPIPGRPVSMDLLIAIGAAMTPVMFAYGGWQTSSFMSGELRRPGRDLVLGLLVGVVGVILLYVAVNAVCLKVLGPEGLAATTTPASAVMRAAFGSRGAKLIAAGIAISTLGFLSQGMLTAPRVYMAMAEDRVFFRPVGWIHPRTHVPVMAIVLQGLVAVLIALSGRYEQILNYVVSVDFIFFGLTGLSLFVLRKRAATADHQSGFRAPGHPASTLLFIAACWLVVAATIWRYPMNSAIGLMIVLLGIPAYLLWKKRELKT